MARVARIVIPNVPHHVTQRGNNREDVFFDDDGRRLYLRLLGEHATRFGLDILAWCLMANHVHLVAIPRRHDSLALAMGRTDYLYTQRINRQHDRDGHLWKNRFHSCALDDKHAVAAVRYVELNPVRAGVAKRAWDYPWSSARAHVTGKDSFGLLNLALWLKDWSPKEWREMICAEIDEASRSLLQYNTSRGLPLGSDDFIDRIARLTTGKVRIRPVGRPPRGGKL